MMTEAKGEKRKKHLSWINNISLYYLIYNISTIDLEIE